MSGRSGQRGARPGVGPAPAAAPRDLASTHLVAYSVRAVNNQLGLSYFELETVSTRANS